MKRKWNVFLNIGLVCLCLVAIAVGVYSAKDASLSVNGTIGFAANDCEVEIVASMSGGSSSSETFTEATKTTTINLGGNNDKTKQWEVGTVYFDDYVNTTPYKPVADIVFTFNITNNSNFYVDANINQDFLGDDKVYVYAPNLGETLAPKASCTFTVKLQLQRDETTGEFPPTLDLSFSDASPIITFSKCDAPAYLATNWKSVITSTFGISDITRTMTLNKADDSGNTTTTSTQSGITQTSKLSFVRTLSSGSLTGFTTDDNGIKKAIIGANSLGGTAVSSESKYTTDTVSPIEAYYKADTKEIVVYSPARIYVYSNCSGLFQGWQEMTDCILTNFDTSNVTNMQSMFGPLYHSTWSSHLVSNSLANLDISQLDTSNVTNGSMIFYYCGALTELNLKNFNTSKMTKMAQMFNHCTSLTKVDVSNFDLSSFSDSMYGMFLSCSSLTSVDLISWDMSGVTDISSFFGNCSKLKTIYANKSWDMPNLTGHGACFSSCSVLEGGNGTKYSSTQTNGTYARIDGEYGLLGYFTKRD